MGLQDEDLHAVGAGSDTDQVQRRAEFVRRHPEVSVLLPREAAATGLSADEFHAVWTDGQPRDGVVVIASHRQLEFLLDYLEARFDLGGMGDRQ